MMLRSCTYDLFFFWIKKELNTRKINLLPFYTKGMRPLTGLKQTQNYQYLTPFSVSQLLEAAEEREEGGGNVTVYV
jgi:hypothetical protein